MKICKTCEILKDENEFGLDRQKSDGLNCYCKVCIKKRSKLQKQKNHNYYEKYRKNYVKENKEKLKEKRLESYYLNLEKRREQSKRSYEKNKKEIAVRRAKKRKIQEEKEKIRLRHKEWRKLNRTRVGEITSEWKKRNPQKAAAHTLILWAVRTGVIVKSEFCQECKKIGKVEGHHIDYSRPLDVIWLCKNCHSKKHAIYR